VERIQISSGTPWEPLSLLSCGSSWPARPRSGYHRNWPDGKIVGAGDVYAQAVQTLKNIERALDRAGASLKDVVRTRIFLTNIGTGKRWESTRRIFPRHPPRELHAGDHRPGLSGNVGRNRAEAIVPGENSRQQERGSRKTSSIDYSQTWPTKRRPSAGAFFFAAFFFALSWRASSPLSSWRLSLSSGQPVSLPLSSSALRASSSRSLAALSSLALFSPELSSSQVRSRRCTTDALQAEVLASLAASQFRHLPLPSAKRLFFLFFLFVQILFQRFA